MSKLLLIRDKVFQNHLTPEDHPESPKRLSAIDAAIDSRQLNLQIEKLAAKPASDDELCLVHAESYLHHLSKLEAEAKKRAAIVQLDPDTWMSPQSYEIARLAAGAGVAAVESLAANLQTVETVHSLQNAFVAVRPPGHHALRDRSMGFCLFNNVAIAAKKARALPGIERVLIIDWDVHHGNGTQEMFYHDPSICFISLHQFPNWPGTGWYKEDGTGDGRGFNLNIPLPPNTGDHGYLRAWQSLVEPVAREYKPQLILLSAGYDAHKDDPLAQQKISTNGYRMLAKRLQKLSVELKAPVLALLEGGYNTGVLAQSVIVTIEELIGKADEVNPELDEESHWQRQQVDERIAELRAHFSSYWNCLR
jgi:acetoin utilization deacetylase AcuC-like enzyme